MSLWRRKCCSNRVSVSGEITVSVEDYLERERNKAELGDFTLSEYNEKGTSNLELCCVLCTAIELFASELVSYSLRNHGTFPIRTH